MKTRADDVLASFEYIGKVVQFKRRNAMDFNSLQQLPTYGYIIERYLTLMKEKPKTLPSKQETVLSEINKGVRGVL